MPRLPSAQDINRQTPSVERQVVALPVDPMGKTMQQAGNTLQQSGARLQRQAYKMGLYEDRLLAEEKQKLTRTQKAFAQTGFVQDLNDWQAQAMEDTDYSTQPQRFNEFAQKSLQKYSANIGDEEERTLFELSAKQDISIFGLKLRKNAYGVRNKQLIAGLDDNYNRGINQISATDDVSTIQRIAQTLIEQINALENDGTIAPSQAAEKKRELKSSIAYSQLDKMKPEDLLKVFSGKSKSGGFDNAIDVVLQNEGGFVANDGNSGAPANFGINQKANPDIDVANLNVDQAKQLYKTRYWDKYNLQEVPDDVQAIVFDGVVNHRSDFAKELVDAAKNGASLTDIKNMRNEEYMRLASLDPKKYQQFLGGWQNRLDKFNQLDDYAEFPQYISPEKQSQLQNKAIKTIEKQQKDAIEQQEQAILIDTVSKAISGEGYINPKDTKQMKMLDAVYENNILNNPDVTDKVAATSVVVNNTGVLPKSFSGRMQQVFRISDDPNEIALYADIYANTEEQNPQVLNDLPSETKLMASYIAEGRRAGIDVSDRVLSMREAMSVENKPMIEKRTEQLKDKTMKSTIDSNVNGLFDGWLPFMGNVEIDTATGINQRVVSDYNTAFKQSYLMTEDADAANKYATALVKGQYAPSVFAPDGGIMKHPPEMYYSIPNRNPDWIKSQLIQEVNEVTSGVKLTKGQTDNVQEKITTLEKEKSSIQLGKGETYADALAQAKISSLDAQINELKTSINKSTPYNAENIYIMSDSKTMVEAVSTKKPSYAIFAIDPEYGAAIPLKKRFIPDVLKAKSEVIIKQNKIKEQRNKPFLSDALKATQETLK